jgi:hypothetical protein
MAQITDETSGYSLIVETVFAGFNSQYKQSKLHCLESGDKSTPKEIPKRREGIGPKVNFEELATSGIVGLLLFILFTTYHLLLTFYFLETRLHSLTKSKK